MFPRRLKRLYRGGCLVMSQSSFTPIDVIPPCTTVHSPTKGSDSKEHPPLREGDPFNQTSEAESFTFFVSSTPGNRSRASRVSLRLPWFARHPGVVAQDPDPCWPS